MGPTRETEEHFRRGLWGWIGAQWRKLAMVWGYSDRYVENVIGTASGAGDAAVGTATPDADEVFVLQQVSVYHDAAANKLLHVYLYTGSLLVTLIYEGAAVPGSRYCWNGRIVYKNGDTVRASVEAPGDTKRVLLYAWGYKMKVG